MEHSHAHRTLLQRPGGNVHPHAQISSRINDEADGREGETVMEKCELFQSHLNEWRQFTPPHQDWTNMKQQFGEACENLLISGQGVGVPGTISNTQ